VSLLAPLAAAVLVASCGAPASQPGGSTSLVVETTSGDTPGGQYGLTITAPSGWHATIARGAIRFANRDVPALALCGGPRALEPADLVVDVLERDPPPEERSFFTPLDRPPQLAPEDFRAPEPGTYPEDHGAARVPFSLAGRFFDLFAESGSRPIAPAVAAQANEILATLAVEPGDLYPGEVEPASFATAEGWHTGSSGSRPVGADGDWTASWAATVPYRDPWNALPMQETLATLPADGIVVWLSLSRFCDPNGPGQRWPVHSRPYRLADFEVLPGWEGQVRDLPEYRLWTRVEGQYEVDARVYFGRPDPSEDMLARAQEEIDRLRLPDWGPWELE